MPRRLCGPVTLLVLLLGANSLDAGKFNRVLNVGDRAPQWKNLAGADGKSRGLSDFKEARLLVVAFICNRCPTTKLYLSRLKSFLARYRSRGVRLVAISCSLSPADRLEKMSEFVKTNEIGFPYLHDPSQSVGKAYGATHTPHFFVLDQRRRIAYMGAFDDHADPQRLSEHYLINAVDALLDGKTPEVTETRQFGCEIEYRSK